MADPTVVVDEGHENAGYAEAANIATALEVPSVNEPSRASSSRVPSAMFIPPTIERSTSPPPKHITAGPDDTMVVDDELVVPKTLTLQEE